MAQHDKDSGIGARNVRKTAPDGYDRNPARTHRTDSLEGVFATATDRLIHSLTEILEGREAA